MAYKYFHFSLEQFNERKSTYDKLNKDWAPGTVIYNGKAVEYTAISNEPILPRFSDAKLVAEGETTELVISDPIIKQKGMR